MWNIEINWVQAFVAVVVGILLKEGAEVVVKAAKGYFSKCPYTTLPGKTLHAYYYSTQEDGRIICGILRVWKDLYGANRVEFTFTNRDNKSLHYQGTMHIRDKLIYLRACGKEHDEEINVILSEPQNRKIDRSIAVVSGLSFNNRPYAGKMLISATELKPNAAGIMLRDPANEEVVLNPVPSKQGPSS